jgi:phosphopantetheinyl transferase
LDALASPLAGLETRDPLCPAGECDVLNGSRRIARIALRRLLARSFGRTVAGQPFQAGPHGKPALAGLSGDFNLSHTYYDLQSPGAAEQSAAVALVGLGRIAPIGVDLEPFRTVRLDARRRASIIAAGIAVADGAPLRDDEETAVIQAWTRLEAWGKADGRGIGRTLSHFGIWGRAGAPVVAPLPGQGVELTVHDVDAAPGLFAAVALPRGVAPPKVMNLPADPAALGEILTQPAMGLNSGVDLAPRAGQKGRIGA